LYDAASAAGKPLSQHIQNEVFAQLLSQYETNVKFKTKLQVQAPEAATFAEKSLDAIHQHYQTPSSKRTDPRGRWALLHPARRAADPGRPAEVNRAGRKGVRSAYGADPGGARTSPQTDRRGDSSQEAGIV